jgi:hypothetical protein
LSSSLKNPRSESPADHRQIAFGSEALGGRGRPAENLGAPPPLPAAAPYASCPRGTLEGGGLVSCNLVSKEAPGAGLVRDNNARATTVTHHLEKRTSVRRRKPHAAVTCRTPELTERVGPMDRITPAEEQRVRHRRPVIFSGVPHPLHAADAIVARRGPISPSGSRHWPIIGKLPVHVDPHSLR